MDEHEFLAERFQEHRDHLRAVAYRMLGSLTEADDAVQEAWLRLARVDTGEIANMGGWLTTVISRVCLDMLRSRKSRREEPLDTHVPDPTVTSADPAEQAEIVDSVGLALLVVLEMLSPAERLAFVLHDMFGLPFGEIAPIVGRSPAAAAQMASRARRRVRGAAVPDADLPAQRAVVDAFTAAARAGDFEALVAVLDPDIVLRADMGAGPSRLVRGAKTVAGQALLFTQTGAPTAHPVLINGVAGLLTIVDGQPFAVFSPVVRGGRIIEINILADPERLARLDLAGLVS
ncbi:RNA polymerase sigma-70 factor (ECF subfamily) [Herbihabitans rhizosphaerae]|uniref:RNA polymerase sigma-70 factor (ECF subfamily) n=1 Tax=Herbihabitans rhizosphaerae TaxID=1872711 RepID=A0A4Q7KLT0_9PSEU|nr:sigma-70 family RNA polymerase sigma factor [Herbihabitans rhizosphaerae]RZS37485.1 RNA polymerase sigma-70 factor (ECF subfamily) [Herbihabitans rhizosphaerae]